MQNIKIKMGALKEMKYNKEKYKIHENTMQI